MLFSSINVSLKLIFWILDFSSGINVITHVKIWKQIIDLFHRKLKATQNMSNKIRNAFYCLLAICHGNLFLDIILSGFENGMVWTLNIFKVFEKRCGWVLFDKVQIYQLLMIIDDKNYVIIFTYCKLQSPRKLWFQNDGPTHMCFDWNLLQQNFDSVIHFNFFIKVNWALTNYNRL